MDEKNDTTVGSARTATDQGAALPETGERNAAEKAAPVAGAVAGAVAGGTAGTLVAGPIGTAIGALAGAVGGWWAGQGIEQSAELSPEDEARYRAHYESESTSSHERDWEHARAGYQLGQVAASNPDYRGRAFTEIEEDLRKGWANNTNTLYDDWDRTREHAREAYEMRAHRGTVEANDDAGAADSRRSFSDPLPHSAGAGASGHPGVARGPDDLPPSATRPTQPGGRSDAGAHPSDVTGRETNPAP